MKDKVLMILILFLCFLGLFCGVWSGFQKSEIDILENKNEILEEQIVELEDNNAILKNQLNNYGNKVNELFNDLAVEQYRVYLTKLKAERLSEEIAELNKKIEDLEDKLNEKKLTGFLEPVGEYREIRVYPSVDNKLTVKIFEDEELSSYEKNIWFFKTIAETTYALTENENFSLCAAAHASTEAGWGRLESSIYIKSNNLFGIQAPSNWTGKVYSSTKQRVYNSYSEAAKYGGRLWKAYDCFEDSILDYYNLVQAKRYDGAVTVNTPKQYFKILYEGDYFNNQNIISDWIDRIHVFSPYVIFEMVK